MIGQTISHYKILEKIGEGGMGIVYKAQDTNLDRFVALKFLPERLSNSEQDRARFLQEAKAASALNHPNICTIHGIEEHNGQMFIDMELVEGQTLRDKKGSISFKQAIDIGIQLAEGLAVAHDKGIVHRDIKPDNIMIRKDGIAQIMDFGLAKLRGVSRLTKEGSTVGTAGYMSPEQVQGQDADHRSDIFSLGVLLYELLTGQLPFRGVHESALMYEIVNVDAPPMSSVKPEMDPSLDAIVLECMEKDPNERTQSVKQVAIDLKRFKRESSRTRASMVRPAMAQSSVSRSDETKRSAAFTKHERWYWAGALVIAVGLVLYGVMTRRADGSSERLPVRFTIPPPAKAVIVNSAVSPDGKKIAFTAISNGFRSLWIRPLNGLEAQLLQGTENAAFPFWSPDGRNIGFFADGKLKKVDHSGGQSVVICEAPNGMGGTWSKRGEILFTPGTSDGLFLVSAGGGIPKRVTSVDSSKNESSHRWPCFLPDAKHFLFIIVGAIDEDDKAYLASIDDTSRVFVVTSNSNILFAEPSHILFSNNRTLMAQSFEPGSGRLLGEPFPIANNVGTFPLIQLGDFSYSPAGILTTGLGRGVNRRYAWFDRKGTSQGTACPPGNYFDIGISPSGNQAVIQKVDVQTNNSDIWTLDIRRNLISRFTFDEAIDDDPAWSADGKYIYYSNAAGTAYDVYRKAANGIGTPEMITKPGKSQKPRDCSMDGKYLLYEVTDPITHLDAWVLPLNEPDKAFPYLQSTFDEMYPQFSPDGKWVVYASNESGKFEIYVQSFPAGSGRWQVSTNGGSQPRWRRDGKELFYVASDLKMMSVPIRSGAAFDFGLAEPLFQTRIDNYTAPNRYVVVENGQKFLINMPVDEELINPITVSIYPFNRENAQ